MNNAEFEKKVDSTVTISIMLEYMLPLMAIAFYYTGCKISFYILAVPIAIFCVISLIKMFINKPITGIVNMLICVFATRYYSDFLIGACVGVMISTLISYIMVTLCLFFLKPRFIIPYAWAVGSIMAVYFNNTLFMIVAMIWAIVFVLMRYYKEKQTTGRNNLISNTFAGVSTFLYLLYISNKGFVDISLFTIIVISSLMMAITEIYCLTMRERAALQILGQKGE